MAQLIAASLQSPDNKRRRCPSKKLSGFVRDQLTGFCPGCNKFVSENGVACIPCAAYWHYKCADVTEDDIALLGDKDFYCSSHNMGSRKEAVVPSKSKKVEPYSLNMKSVYKKLLKNLSAELSSEKKDQGKQYLVTLNTATYLIMLSKIVEMGESAGLSIKSNCDLDEKETKSQFDLVISQGGLQVPIAMTWFHTTTNVLIQVKGRRKEKGLNKKLDVLEAFVNTTLSGMVHKVENSAVYSKMKENIHQEVSNASLNINNESESIAVEEIAEMCIGTIPICVLLEGTEGEEKTENFRSISSQDDTHKLSLSLPVAPLMNGTPQKGADDNHISISCDITNTSYPIQVNGSALVHNEIAPLPLAVGNKSAACPMSAHKILNESDEIELRKEIERLNKLYEQEKASLKACQHEMEDQDKDRKAQLLKKNGEISKLVEKNEKLKEEKTKLSSDVSEKEKVQKCHETKLSTQKQEILSMKQKLKTLEDHQLVLQTTIEKQGETISSQKLLINEQELSLNSHFNLAASFMEEIEDEGVAEEDGDTSFSTGAVHENSFQAKKSSVKLKEVLMEQRKKIDSLQEANIRKDEELVQVEGSLQVAKEKAKAEMKEASKEIGGLKETLHHLEISVAESKAAVKEYYTKYSDMSLLAEKLQHSNSDLTSRLETVEKENKSLSDRKGEEVDPQLVQQLKKQLEEKVNDLESLSSFYATLKEEVEILREEKVAWGKDKKYLEKVICDGKAKLLESEKKAQSAALAKAAAEEELNSAYQLKHAQKAEKGVIRKENSFSVSVAEEREQNEIDSSHVCLFELKDPGSCKRGKKCKFEHNIPVTLRNSTQFIQQAIESHSNKMAFCAVEFVAKGSCNADECRFNHDITDSNLRRKTSDNINNKKKYSERLCYKELEEKDSCPFGKERCHFCHDFPETLRSDRHFIQKTLEERKVKLALCVNEFYCKGGCNKKRNCRFNHEITDEQRQDPDWQTKMKVKLEKISQKNIKEEVRPQIKGGNGESHLNCNILKEMAELRMMVMELRERYF